MSWRPYASHPSVRWGQCVAVAIVCLLGFVSVSLAASEHDDHSSWRPGRYIVWASAKDPVCGVTRDLVNTLPDQDVVRAASSGAKPFLEWSVGPRIGMKGNALQPPYFPLSHLVAGKGSRAQLFFVRYSGTIASTPTDALFVRHSLPVTPDDARKGIGHPDFSTYQDDAIARAQRLHGKMWSDWYISGQVLISAFGKDGWPYFLATHTVHDVSKSTRILVFTFDENGRREDVCMLRRICGCSITCQKSLTTERERHLLLPSALYCKG